MRKSGTWKKRISIWLSMALAAGNMVSAASPAVYADEKGMQDPVALVAADDLSEADYCQTQGHAYRIVDEVYDQETGMDRVTMECEICGETNSEWVEHDHERWWSEEITDYNGEDVEIQKTCTKCGFTEKQSEKHHLVCEYGKPTIGAEEQIRINGSFYCLDSDCDRSLKGTVDFSSITSGTLMLNTCVEKESARNFTDFYSFELKNPEMISVILNEQSNPRVTLFKREKNRFCSLRYQFYQYSSASDLTQREYGLLEAGTYYLKIIHNYSGEDTFLCSLQVVDQTKCESQGHLLNSYHADRYYDYCERCSEIVPNKNSVFESFNVEDAVDIDLNTGKQTEITEPGMEIIYRFNLDHVTQLGMNGMDFVTEYGADSSIRHALYKEMDNGKLLLISNKINNPISCTLPAGTYYVKNSLDYDWGTGSYLYTVCNVNYCESNLAYQSEVFRFYSKERNKDKVRTICKVCDSVKTAYKKHRHDYRWKTIRVNTGSAMLEDYYRCRACKEISTEPGQRIPESADPAEVNEDFTIEVDQRDWKVLSFDVEEADSYSFVGRTVSNNQRDGLNVYATIYRDNTDGTLTRIIGNAFPEASGGFRFEKQLEEGHYYAVVRSNLPHVEDENDYNYPWKAVRMHIAHGTQYCEKYGHSGSLLEILEISTETNEVTVRRKCDTCGEIYTITEQHTLRNVNTRLATGSSITGPEAVADYDCLDPECDFHGSFRQPLADAAVKTELNTDIFTASVDMSLPGEKTTRYFEFTIDEEQEITLYCNVLSDTPSQDMILYRLDGDRLTAIQREKVTSSGSSHSHAYKAFLTPGTYYYRITAKRYYNYDTIIFNTDYCAEYGHFYQDENGLDQEGKFCIVCMEPYTSDESLLYDLPENADMIERNVIREYPLDGSETDIWLTFTMDQAQRVIAACASEEAMSIDCTIYRETGGKMTLFRSNSRYGFGRTAAYLNPGTYYLHCIASYSGDPETASVKVGVLDPDYCSKSEHLYTLLKVSIRGPKKIIKMYKCVVCTDHYNISSNSHTHSWGKRTWNVTESGKVEKETSCLLCGEKKVLMSVALSDIEGVTLQTDEQNTFILRKEALNRISFQIEEEDNYSITALQEVSQKLHYLFIRENEAEASYERLESGIIGSTWIHNVRLEPGRYHFVVTDCELSLEEEVEAMWALTKGQTYCECFGHELNPNKTIDTFDPVSGWTRMESRCRICRRLVYTEEYHHYQEDTQTPDKRRKIATGLIVSGSVIRKNLNQIRTSYICTDCDLTAVHTHDFYDDKLETLSLNTITPYTLRKRGEYVMVPFYAEQEGIYQIRLPQDLRYDVFAPFGKGEDGIHEDEGTRSMYIEAGRGYVGDLEMFLVQGNYLLLIDSSTIKSDMLEIGFFAEGLHLTRSEEKLTAVYYGSEQPVNQGILVYPGEMKGNLTQDTTPRTRIAFTRIEDGCFSLDISDLPEDMTYRAYAEYADGTIEYSNIE